MTIIILLAVPQMNPVEFLDPGYTEDEVELWGAIVFANEIRRTGTTAVPPRVTVPQCGYQEGDAVWPPIPYFHEGTQ